MKSSTSTDRYLSLTSRTDLLGDLEQLAEPDIYYEAMKGVRNLVSMFLAVGKNRLGENVSDFILVFDR